MDTNDLHVLKEFHLSLPARSLTLEEQFSDHPVCTHHLIYGHKIWHVLTLFSRAIGKASLIHQAGCLFVGSVNMTGALHLLHLQLSPPSPSSLALIKFRTETFLYQLTQVHLEKWPLKWRKTLWGGVCFHGIDRTHNPQGRGVRRIMVFTTECGFTVIYTARWFSMHTQNRPGCRDMDPGSILSTFPESGWWERRWFRWCRGRADRVHRSYCRRCSRGIAESRRPRCNSSCYSETSGNSTTHAVTEYSYSFHYECRAEQHKN